MALTRPRAAQIYNLDYKQATRVVTVANITLAGGAPSVVDGVTLSNGDRVLVTAQSTPSQNGLYYVSTAGSGSNGTWTRTTDANQTGEIDAGMIVMVTEGLIYADTQWKLITDNPITIGTTALTFTQNYLANAIQGGTSNVTVYSNANVTISSGGTPNVLIVTSGGTVVKGTESVSGNITVGNVLTSGLLSATGNINGNYLNANIYYATGFSASRIFSGTSEANIGTANGNANITIGGVSNVAVFASTGEYITGVLSVSGNITGGNIATAGQVSATANITGGNVLTTGLITATANITGGNLSTTGLISATGTITSAANVIGGNITTAGQVSATANITGGNILTAGLISATSTITSAANVIGGNITTVGIISSTGNAIHGNILTGGLISATANVIGGNVLAGAYFYANGAAFTGGGGGSPGGSNTQIQYNNNGVFAGSAALTFNNTTNAIATTGTFSATANITGGNILTAGVITATANITGGNILTAGVVSSTGAITATANITGGNILTAGVMSSTGNAIHGNILTAGVASIGGTITAGGSILPTGNATANIGSSTNQFNTIYARATSAQYADLAEMYCADATYTPGTVVEFGGDQEVTITTETHSTRVAGIISTNPSYLMNSTIACENNSVEVALVGRVPCQVVGTIRKGDRLVSSRIPGTAQAMNRDLYEPGCIVGKALEDYNSNEPGIIEVAVGRT